MRKPVIRSVTVFTRRIDDWGRGFIKHVIEEAEDLLVKSIDELKERGYSVWTKRISFPQPPPSAYEHLPSLLTEFVSGDIMVSIGGLLIERIQVKILMELLEKGFYVPLIPRNETDFLNVAELLHVVANINPIYCSQIALSLTRATIETPYFPLSTSINGLGVGIALLYPNLLRDVYSKRGLRGLRKAIRAIETDLIDALSQIKTRIGIDFSISPWMEESVANLVTAITGALPNEPGFINGIAILNNILREVTSGKPHAIGYNEVMLPLAEDDGLKEISFKNNIKARDFLLFSSVCITGPDMIVVPWDKNKLTRYILDARSIAIVKRKIMGLRVIPVEDKEPGDIIDLGKFGKVPVIPY
ncbi:DUF711 family protein [Desulfurococcaceae archaeon MEX13E-LK6-19]|nr:DUF711 family protein [Desulfurococcaceae archaeon MEX13E-LK6-19]